MGNQCSNCSCQNEPKNEMALDKVLLSSPIFFIFQDDQFGSNQAPIERKGNQISVDGLPSTLQDRGHKVESGNPQGTGLGGHHQSNEKQNSYIAEETTERVIPLFSVNFSLYFLFQFIFE